MITRNRLTRTQSFALVKLVIETYAATGASDNEFAATASEQLGFAVPRSSVLNIRKDFNIPPNARAPKQTKPQGWRATIDATLLSLLRRVDELEASLVAAQRDLAKCKGYSQPR